MEANTVEKLAYQIYGGPQRTDNLSRFLSLAAIVFLFISMFTNGSAVGSAAFVLALPVFLSAGSERFQKYLQEKTGK